MNEPSSVDPMLADAMQRYGAALKTYAQELRRLTDLDAHRATPFLRALASVTVKVDHARVLAEPLAVAAELEELCPLLRQLTAAVLESSEEVN